MGVKHDLDEADRLLRQRVSKDDLEAAADLCRLAISAAPHNARAHFLLGAAEQRAGRIQEAATHALKAAHLRPDLPALQDAAGSLLCRCKEFDKALPLHDAAAKMDPSNARYHLGVASALRKLGRNNDAEAAFRRAAFADPSDPHVQYKLGQHLRSTGCLESAVEAYSRALELYPDHALAAFWLPATRKLAAEAGVTIKNDSWSVQTSAREEVPPPTTAPPEYVVALYNSYAETFDAHLQGALAYRTPSIVVETLSTVLPGARFKRCLDLGCGTGLSGQAVSPLCDRVVGVDLSPAMVGRASEKNVYHKLLVGDVTETVASLARRKATLGIEWDVCEPPNIARVHGARDSQPVIEGAKVEDTRIHAELGEEERGENMAISVTTDCPGSARNDEATGDLILSCDVFGYIGDLRPCFEAVRDLLGENDGGEGSGGSIFAFSAEAPPRTDLDGAASSTGMGSSDIGGAPPGYELQGTGRYTHRHEYLHGVCRDSRLRVRADKEVILRKNAGLPVKGYVFITEPCTH